MSELRNNSGRSRYEMDEQGATSYADYRVSGDRMYLDYVFAPPQLRGTGAAGRLMAAVAADAREHGEATEAALDAGEGEPGGGHGGSLSE